ncbi:MAG: glycoside hydrolase family 113 [Flavobacteriales bacterium]
MKQILMYLGLFMTISCYKGDDCPQMDNTKMNGVSWVSSNTIINSSHIQPVVDVEANYSALIPFAFLPALNSTEIQYNVNNQWWGETEDGIRATAQLFKNAGIKRLLKPQIWVLGGKFVGHIKMDSEADWIAFEKKYTEYILFYAKIAEDEKIEAFSIGTELKTVVLDRPDYWSGLIEEVKKVYSGELTYAANWDSYQNPNFWDKLDFIGIDAYFPLSDKQTPTIEEIETAWNPIKNEIRKIALKTDKPVVFTEYGYRSVDFTALEPWEGSHSIVNLKAQENAIQGLYNTFWNEPWFKGGFLWKWFDKHETAGGIENNRFTVQNKPSEELVKNWYKKFK